MRMDGELLRLALSQLSGARLACGQLGGFTISGSAHGRAVLVSKSVSAEPCPHPTSYLLVVAGALVAVGDGPGPLELPLRRVLLGETVRPSAAATALSSAIGR